MDTQVFFSAEGTPKGFEYPQTPIESATIRFEGKTTREPVTKENADRIREAVLRRTEQKMR
ncbi:MAG: hypothetical protein ACJ8AO_20230 [Gemmatimonadaceae bacterium]